MGPAEDIRRAKEGRENIDVPGLTSAIGTMEGPAEEDVSILLYQSNEAGQMSVGGCRSGKKRDAYPR